MRPQGQHILEESSIGQLPSPVARSLRRSGVLGRPIPQRVRLHQRGEILLRDRWFPFTADETYALDPPSFEWNATVKVAGMPIARACDSFANSRGRMHVQLLKLFTVVDATGMEMDQGALLRWLNETMWFPQVWATDVFSWEPIDDAGALARVSASDVSVEAEFRFNGEGRLVDFRADRYRIEGAIAAMTPWRTPLTGYGSFGGVEIPNRGYAVWELETGHLEYIRLQISDVQYDYRRHDRIG